MDQADGLRTWMKRAPQDKTASNSVREGAGGGKARCPRVLSVASGKGGVGKTNVVANLGFAFTQLGKRVLILDADLGLANIDVLLGLTPRYTIEHLFNRTKTFDEVLMKGPGGMSIMPASSGVLDLVDLNDEQKLLLLSEIDLIADQVDVLLIDTGAGISSNVLYFNMAARESIVIVTPEPTSVTDAYALIKVLFTRFKKESVMLLVNLVENDQEAREVFRKIHLVVDRFLGHKAIDYLGFIPIDEKLPLAVKQQRAVLDIYPRAPSSRRFAELARRLAAEPAPYTGEGQIQFFWKQLLQSRPVWDSKGECG